MSRIVGYIRVSTDGQAERGLGLESQRHTIKSYCDIYNLDLVEIIVDEGLSAKSLNRPGIQRAIEMTQNGEADGIICAKLDRLTRSIKDLHTLLDNVFSNTELHIVAEKVDTSTAAGRLILNVLCSVAEWEREAIGERTSAALQTKKRNAGNKINGRPPFGYQWEEGQLIPNSSEYPILEVITELRSIGQTYAQIAAKLTEMGYMTKRGGNWTPMTVRRISIRENERQGTA